MPDLAEGAIAWRPPADALSNTNVGQFLVAHGLDTFPALRRRSIDDPEWFWSATAEWLGVPFSSPYSSVLDTSNGIEWARWFTGATLNAADFCVDRWARIAPDRQAVVWEGEDGDVRAWSYRELQAQTDALAVLLAARGVSKGDVIGIYMPMLPETVAAVMATAKLGAVFLPLFSGYGADAVAVRLTDGGAKAVVTADGYFRRGAPIDMLATLATAISGVDTVHTVVVVPRLGRPLTDGLDLADCVPWPAGQVADTARPARDAGAAGAGARRR